MWPWEHVAFAYLLASTYTHWRLGRSPGEYAAIGVVLASQLPDLVDKPFAWVLGVLPGGQSLAHSLFVAIPFVLLTLAVARSRTSPGARVAGAAVSIAYLSHLVGDVIYPLATGHGIQVRFLFWPLLPVGGGATHPDVLAYVAHLAGAFLGFLSTPLGLLYLALEVGLLAAGLLRWLRDGTPGLALLRTLLVRRRSLRDQRR